MCQGCILGEHINNIYLLEQDDSEYESATEDNEVGIMKFVLLSNLERENS